MGTGYWGYTSFLESRSEARSTFAVTYFRGIYFQGCWARVGRCFSFWNGYIHTYKPKSNIGAGKLFHRNTSFPQRFPLKIKKYFGHKLIKNPWKNDISTIFWKLLSGSIRRTHPLFTVFIKRKKKQIFMVILPKQLENTKIWRISPLRGLCDRTDSKK